MYSRLALGDSSAGRGEEQRGLVDRHEGCISVLNSIRTSKERFPRTQEGLDLGVRHLEGILEAYRFPVANMDGLGREHNRVRRKRPARARKKDGVAHRSVEILGAMGARACEPPAAINEQADSESTGTGQSRGLELTIGRRHVTHSRAHHSRLNMVGSEGSGYVNGDLER